MKSLLRILAIAAAFGLAPAAGYAQGAAQPAATPTPAAAPSDAISAKSQAHPAQPQDVSAPGLATPAKEEPSNASIAAATGVAQYAEQPGVGQPDGRALLQDQFTPIGEEAAWFHNAILMPVVAAISLFVLALLLIVIVRFRRAANPEPSRTSHNTVLEVVWTLVPVLILVVIAVPSIRLLAHQYDPPKADLTIKAIGNQWYWTYQYPDNGDFELVSNVLSDKDAKAKGEPRLLGVDEPVVVPAGAVVKVITTSNDVIHSWAVPSFWVKMDAVPGRLNETWFKVDRPGVYYGECSELCGARHAYMPIEVKVVPRPVFIAWVHSKGGTMPGEKKPTSSDSTQASPLANPAAPTVGAVQATAATPAPTNVVNATAAAPAISQGQQEAKSGGDN